MNTLNGIEIYAKISTMCFIYLYEII